MNLMNTQLQEFKTQAYKDGKFLEVSHEDVLGKWAILSGGFLVRLPHGAQ